MRVSSPRRRLGRVSSFAALGIVSLTLFGLIARAQDAPAQGAPAPTSPSDALMRDLPWRNIGPAIMGGRIDDIAAVESDPHTVYVGTAAGGIMKTTNNGTTWQMVFDGQETGSIGSIGIAQSDPRTVYVGTGEANNRQSSTWGNGVYKSTDAGKTWEYVGLKETHHIGRVVVHPTNPDVAYVAAGGRLWGPNPERGLFKTSDGGKTWEKILFVDDDTGCTDVALDPSNPDTVFAATYTRRRTAFGFAGGGPGSGLHKSTDGGKTWKKMEGGFPTGVLGRIGISIYRKDPKIIYACVETQNSGSTQNTLGGGVYRSTDGGETWEKRGNVDPRPMYFSQIRVDPNNSDRVFLPGVTLYASADGGKTFRTAPIKVHADGHALWINPADSREMIMGTDGGIQWTYDGGQTWDYNNTCPIGQFYEVHYDFRQPYWVYGGLQDNGSWGAPSRTPGLPGVTNDDWINVGGGDGFYAQADATDPTVVYSESQQGSIRRLNVATGESKSIRPRPNPGEAAYRFDWNTPFLISPHNPRKLLLGGNHLFISTDRGDTWRETPDLSTNTDRTKLPILGAPVTRQTLSANDGQESFGQIVTLTESPVKEGVIYVGTDDGNLQVSTDDGKTWKNVAPNVPELPKGTYVTRVSASRFAPGRCYATFDNHRSNDFMPYAYVTEDYGQTWKPIATGLPEGSTVHVVREHPCTENLLFMGTERGAYVSFDRGVRWQRFGAPFPPSIPVNDIQIHPRDNALIFATHARSIWILDDLGPFEALASAPGLNGPVLAAPPPAVEWRLANRKGVTGDRTYTAPNPPFGAAISFYLPDANATGFSLTILDKDGKRLVRELRQARPRAGWNRVVWDFRAEPPIPPQDNGGGPGGGGGGGFGGFGAANGPRVLPGRYTVRLTVGSVTRTQPIVVSEDPRLTLSDRDRKAIYETAERLGKSYADADAARRTLSQARGELSTLSANASPSVKPRVEALIKRVTELEGRLTPPRRVGPGAGGGGRPGAGGGAGAAGGAGAPGGAAGSEGGEETPPPPPAVSMTQRITRLLATLESFTEPVSEATKRESKDIQDDLKRVLKEVDEINRKELPALRKEIKITGVLSGNPIGTPGS